MFCGNKIKVKFFVMKNIQGGMFAQIKVISPKRIAYEGKIVDLTLLEQLSYDLKDGLYVGIEQSSRNRDSLFVPRNTKKVWNNGHQGYFNIFDTLMSSQDEEVRKTLGVGSCWDGEWEINDILDNLTEKQIQEKLDEYNNDPWIKNCETMEKLWTNLSEKDKFIEECKKQNIPEKIYKWFFEDKRNNQCKKCRRENITCWSSIVNPNNLNETKCLCSDCIVDYKSLYIHGYDEKTGEATPGALVKISNCLKSKADINRRDIDSAIHVCAKLKYITEINDTIWVKMTTKSRTVQMDDGKEYPLYNIEEELKCQK